MAAHTEYESPGQMEKWQIKRIFQDAAMPTHFRVLMKRWKHEIVAHVWLQSFIRERISDCMRENGAFRVFYLTTLEMLDELIESPPPIPVQPRNKYYTRNHDKYKKPSHAQYLADYVPPPVPAEAIAPMLTPDGDVVPEIPVDPVKQFRPLRDIIKDHILEAVRITRTTVGAAKILGVSQRTMRNYVTTYVIDRTMFGSALPDGYQPPKKTYRQEQMEHSRMLQVERAEIGNKKPRARHFHSDQEAPSAHCHPQRAHYTDGLCFACYKEKFK